jgi:hypothetical protein
MLWVPQSIDKTIGLFIIYVLCRHKAAARAINQARFYTKNYTIFRRFFQ